MFDAAQTRQDWMTVRGQERLGSLRILPSDCNDRASCNHFLAATLLDCFNFADYFVTGLTAPLSSPLALRLPPRPRCSPSAS